MNLICESMEEEEEAKPPTQTHTWFPSTTPEDPLAESSSTTPPRFDPSRMIGIIRRKSLIKDLAAGYHSECLAYCQQLLDFHKQMEEPYLNTRKLEDSRKDSGRASKRMKKPL